MGRGLIIAALCSILALQGSVAPLVVQVVAWSTMISQSMEEGIELNDAVRDALSGRSPCHLCCKAIEISVQGSTPDRSLPSSIPAQDKLCLGLFSREPGASIIRRPFLGQVNDPITDLRPLVAMGVPTPPPRTLQSA